MKFVQKILFCLTMVISISSAGDLGSDVQDFQKLKKEFESLKIIKLAGFKIEEIKDLGDVYVSKGKHPQGNSLTIFVTKDKKTVILGNGFNEEAQKIEFTTDMNPYKKDAAYTVGTGKNEYFLFTDPACPWCKKLETNIEKLKKDIKLYVYLVPFKGPKSEKMINYILDAQLEDRAKRMKEIASGDNKYENIKIADEKSNENKKTIEKSMELVRELNIHGTPTTLTSKGTMLQWPMLFDDLQLR